MEVNSLTCHPQPFLLRICNIRMRWPALARKFEQIWKVITFFLSCGREWKLITLINIIPMLQPFVSYFRSGSTPRTRIAMGNIHGNRPVEELAAHSPRATRCTAHLVAASRCGKGTFLEVFSPPFPTRRVWRKLLEDRIIGHKCYCNQIYPILSYVCWWMIPAVIHFCGLHMQHGMVGPSFYTFHAPLPDRNFGLKGWHLRSIRMTPNMPLYDLEPNMQFAETIFRTRPNHEIRIWRFWLCTRSASLFILETVTKHGENRWWTIIYCATACWQVRWWCSIFCWLQIRFRQSRSSFAGATPDSCWAAMHVTQRVWLLMFNNMHMICYCFICSDVRVIIREPRTWEPSFEEKIVPPDAFQENTRELVTNLGPMAPIWRFTKCLFSSFFVFTFSGGKTLYNVLTHRNSTGFAKVARARKYITANVVPDDSKPCGIQVWIVHVDLSKFCRKYMFGAAWANNVKNPLNFPTQCKNMNSLCGTPSFVQQSI